MHVVYGQSTHTIFSPRALIHINGLTLTDFLGQEFSLHLSRINAQEYYHLKPTKKKTLGRARDPRANGAWLSKLTERNMKCLS